MNTLTAIIGLALCGVLLAEEKPNNPLAMDLQSDDNPFILRELPAELTFEAVVGPDKKNYHFLPLPEEYAHEKSVAVKLEDLQHHPSARRICVTFRIINPTDQEIEFATDMRNSSVMTVMPRLVAQKKIDGTWGPELALVREAKSRGSCPIKPQSSMRFEFEIEGDLLPMRFGLNYWISNDRGKKELPTVWSEAIAR